MKPGLKTGMSAETSFKVTPEMRPIFEGEAVHDVLATSWMISWMELISRRIVLPFLDPHETGAGYEVNVRHVAPAPVGTLVSCYATVDDISDTRITCRVRAETANVLVGEGTFTQVVLDRDCFLKRLQNSSRDDEGSGKA